MQKYLWIIPPDNYTTTFSNNTWMRIDSKKKRYFNSTWLKTEYKCNITMLTMEYSGKIPESMVALTRIDGNHQVITPI